MDQFELNASYRLIAMSYDKKDAERVITGLSGPLWEHLGKLFSCKSSPELTKEWSDEIRKNFLSRMNEYAIHLKTKKGKIGKDEAKNWILDTKRNFLFGAAYVISDKKYKRVAKRFKTEEEAEAAAASIDLQVIAQKLADIIRDSTSLSDLRSGTSAIVESVLEQAKHHDN